jgi:tRNA-binding EMAP/Myf-like protein
MRKLATIQKVTNIKKHPNTNTLDICNVLGWEVIIKTGDFKEGDFCVMFQTDSLLPHHEIFEFLEKRKYRIKTQKLRGVISQGLVMPVSIIKTLSGKEIELEEGKDVTELLGVIKHDPEAQKERTQSRKDPKRNPVVNYMLSFSWYRKFHYNFISQKSVKNFPWFIKKTDEERIQNTPWVFNIQDGVECYYTEKLDGTSFTSAIYIPEKSFFLQRLFSNTFYVCSRNLNLHRKNNSEYWRVAEQEDIENKLKKVAKNIAIQGEIVGEGIQKNRYNLKGLHLFVYNVVDIDKQYYYTLKEKQEFCKEYGFTHIPVLGKITLSKDMKVEDMIKLSDGRSVLSPTLREGIVVRSIENDRISFKAINPKYLLKYED